MGAGKTTVGRTVAGLLGWQFRDVDEVLVERSGVTIAELFVAHGEEAFRRQEAEAIRELLSLHCAVIALGGGALESPDTRALLLSGTGTLVVFLETPLHVSLARCVAEPGAAVRPMLQDAAALESRFQKRSSFYQATAGLTLSTQERSPQFLAQRVAEAVRSGGANAS